MTLDIRARTQESENKIKYLNLQFNHVPSRTPLAQFHPLWHSEAVLVFQDFGAQQLIHGLLKFFQIRALVGRYSMVQQATLFLLGSKPP